jgi:hypothetical protein
MSVARASARWRRDVAAGDFARMVAVNVVRVVGRYARRHRHSTMTWARGRL